MKRILVTNENRCRFTFHNWKVKKIFNFSTYYECSKCGARRADITKVGEPVRGTWLIGETSIIKKSPAKKEGADNG